MSTIWRDTGLCVEDLKVVSGVPGGEEWRRFPVGGFNVLNVVVVLFYYSWFEM